MDINISTSRVMDKENADNDEYEHRIIRVPLSYRTATSLSVGDFINLRTSSGVITLQVAPAFNEDVVTDSMCAYVTSSVHRKLAVSNTGSTELKIIRGITLGCDPEVFLVNRHTGNIASAFRFLEKYGQVGHDGYMMEFRPNPSIHASEVCDNLWNLIQQARAILSKTPEGRDILILAASSHPSGLTTGFHLHYGFPGGLLGFGRQTKRVISVINAAFDYYVGIPAILPEGNRDVARRTASHLQYGKPGEFRLDNKTYEFRMPGGINMVHPVLARGLMSLGAVVAEDIASRVNTCTDCFTNLREMMTLGDLTTLYPNIPDVRTFYGVICNSDIGPARHHFQVIKEDVRKMLGYTERAEDIEAYFRVLDLDPTFSKNIEENWGGVYNARQQGEVVIL